MLAPEIIFEMGTIPKQAPLKGTGMSGAAFTDVLSCPGDSTNG